MENLNSRSLNPVVTFIFNLLRIRMNHISHTLLTFCLALIFLACAQPPVAVGVDAEGVREQVAAIAEKSLAAEEFVVRGEDGWMYLSRELRHLGVGRFWGEAAQKVSLANPEYADPMPAIVDLRRQLSEVGIAFLLVPVPPKAAVYPAPLVKDAPATRWDLAHQEFYQLLREQGVEVLDLTDAFIAARDQEGSAPVYCKQDSHWSPRGIEIASKEMLKWLEGKAGVVHKPDAGYVRKDIEIELTGDLTTILTPSQPKPEPESLVLQRVQAADGELIEPDQSSPVIILGDSHTLVFHAGGELHATGCGLADQLAYGLGFPVNLMGVKGSGAGPSRSALYRASKKYPDFFKGRKAVIFCLTAREFTENTGSAWKPKPIRPKAD